MNKNIFWKSISLAFIVLFLIILIGGVLRVYKYKSSFISATDEQIDSAKLIATDFFSRAYSENISDYNLSVSKRVRFIDNKTRVIQVSLKKDSIRLSYLVDVDAKEVLMQTRTESYSRMKDMSEHKERGVKEFKK